MGRRRLPVGTTRFDPVRLKRELRAAQPRPQPPTYDDAAIHVVIVRYARLRANGKPVRCDVSPNETDRARLHSQGKVIYDTYEDARDCVRELRRLTGSTTPSYVYGCNRSRRGHMHVTRKNTPDGKRV